MLECHRQVEEALVQHWTGLDWTGESRQFKVSLGRCSSEEQQGGTSGAHAGGGGGGGVVIV